MSRTVARFLRSSGAVPGITPTTQLNFVKLRSLTSVLSLVFVDEDPVPRYVLKVERDQARAPKLVSACEALRAVSAIPELRKSVPEVVFCGRAGDDGGVFATLETFLDGPMLAIPLGIARDRGDHQEAARLLHIAYQWLISFHEAFRTADPDPHAPQFLADLRMRIASQAMATALGAERIHRLLECCNDICLQALPWGRVHGDFNPYNVIVTRLRPTEVGVIDWDASGPGCQLFDAFQMVVVGHLLPAHPHLRQTHQMALWQGSDPEGAVFQTVLAAYGSDPQTRHQFRLAYALYLAHMLADLQIQAGTRPEPMLDFWKSLLIAELQQQQ